MRLLIVGRSLPEVAEAAAMARQRGASVRHLPTFGAALEGLRAGQGADLLLIEATGAIAAALGELARERIHLPAVAFGIDCPAHLAAAAIKAGAREFLPLPPDAALIAAILETLGGARAGRSCAPTRACPRRWRSPRATRRPTLAS